MFIINQSSLTIGKEQINVEMQKLENGKYLGPNTFERRFDGLIISQNHYQEGHSSSWHYHENSYFAFILKGGSIECRKEEHIECTPGMLLFYNNQEPHKNEKYLKGSRNFNIEFEDSWYKIMEMDKAEMQGGMLIREPVIKSYFVQMMAAAIEQEQDMKLSIETLVLYCLSVLKKDNKKYLQPPSWLLHIKELLHDVSYHSHSLSELAKFAGVHPVTLSKLFPHFFHCTIGEYIKRVRIAHSLSLLSKKHNSLAAISSSCGFADHAHFTRTFKRYAGFTPSEYRKVLFG